jgi:hypothetical protein
MATTVFLYGIPTITSDSDLDESKFNEDVQNSILDWLIQETGKKDWNIVMLEHEEVAWADVKEGELTIIVEGPDMTPPKAVRRFRRGVVRGKYQPRYLGERYPYKAQKELLELRELSGNPALTMEDYLQSTPVERYEFSWRWAQKRH